MALTFRWDGDDISSSARDAVEDGLFQAAEVLLSHSNALVPLDEGPLMNSGTVEVRDGTARVGYNTPYAYRQHEDLAAHHPNGRQAKYLEKPLNQFGSELEAIVGAALNKKLGR